MKSRAALLLRATPALTRAPNGGMGKAIPLIRIGADHVDAFPVPSPFLARRLLLRLRFCLACFCRFRFPHLQSGLLSLPADGVHRPIPLVLVAHIRSVHARRRYGAYSRAAVPGPGGDRNDIACRGRSREALCLLVRYSRGLEGEPGLEAQRQAKLVHRDAGDRTGCLRGRLLLGHLLRWPVALPKNNLLAYLVTLCLPHASLPAPRRLAPDSCSFNYKHLS